MALEAHEGLRLDFSLRFGRVPAQQPLETGFSGAVQAKINGP
jgi:hypothetical protein